MDSLIREALPFLSSSIAPPEQIQQIDSFAREFSGAYFTSLIGFECPLEQSEKWIDFLIHLSPASLGVASALFQKFADSVTVENRALWGRFAFFLKEWKIKNHQWLALELDTGSSSTWPPGPNLFLCTKEFQEKAWVQLVEEISWQLNRRRFNRKERTLLERYASLCFASGIQIFGCGFMMARPVSSIRVDTSSPNFSSSLFLAEHLEKTGYSLTTAASLIQCVKRLEPLIEHCGVALDLGEGLSSRIGYECIAKNSQWEELLAHLYLNHLVSKEKYRACLEWIGETPFQREGKMIGRFLRTINHLKLIFKPEHSLVAKIYLRLQLLAESLSTV